MNSIIWVSRLSRQAGRNIRLFALVAITATVTTTMAACSGSSGEPVETNLPPEVDNDGSGFVYQGPAPQTEDVQNFKINLYDKLVDDNRCGSCHVEGGQSPYFVHRGDVNQAYTAANTVVDLGAPAQSRLVTKVAEGHNCWEAEASVCASVITNYIEAWASDSGAEASVVVLEAPEEVTVGSSKSFPADSTAFSNSVYPILAANCSGCHAETAATPQQPYFASADIDVAYEGARGKISLQNPDSSRLVVRLAAEEHNCWTDCREDAATMLAAIEAFAAGIPETAVDPALVVSRALTLPDGTVASSGGRVESNLIALYEFRTGEGRIAYDTSGVDPALHLNLSGEVDWVGSWGIRINDGKAQGSTANSRKLYDLITATGEYTVEAWVVPENVSQDGPARIVSYSGGDEVRNFTLGQTLYNYDFLNRSSATDANGLPALSTPDALEVLQATLQHVVLTYDPVNGRSIYVNGELISGKDPLGGGTLADWNDTYALVLGQEVSGQDSWRGTLRMLAIHNRALTAEQIAANFEVGVGQKFYLLFGVSHLIDVPDAYIVMQAQQFDDYSYLFTEPFFISLSQTSIPSAIPLQGIRIGINGQELAVGQSFGNLTAELGGSAYGPAGQPLSDLGAVIALQNGPDLDQFFLSFDRLGSHTYVRSEPAVPGAVAGADLPPRPDYGLRLFGEINATLAHVTEVDATRVADVYERVRQQLPPAEDADGFLAAHQAGVMQLAVAYCTELVQDSSLRSSYFQGFNFSDSYTDAFNTTGRNHIIDPLLEHLLAHEFEYGGSTTRVMTQPSPSDPDAETKGTKTFLNDLIDEMAGASTETTVIAVCSAAVGNATMLLQ